MERPVVRMSAWTCLRWFGCEEQACRRVVKSCLVKDIRDIVNFSSCSTWFR